MVKKKKRKKKPLIIRLQNKADKALSLYIREITRLTYSICPLCNKNPIQCCFHFISRRRKILRWDQRNVIGTCHSCNYVERNFPDLSRAWFIRAFGYEIYLELVDESKLSFTPTAEYLEAKIVEYTKDLEAIGGV